MKLRLALFIIPLLVLVSGCQPSTVPSVTTPSAPSNAAEITIEDWDSSIKHVGINELHLETFIVLIANNSSRSIKIGIISLSSGENVIKRSFSESLQLGEKRSFSLTYTLTLARDIGAREVKCKIMVGENIGQVVYPIVAEKEISIAVPIARIGYTQPVGILKDKTITLTLLSWSEKDNILAGPYPDAVYYVCTARPGNKFISLVFELRNDWSKSQKTPYIKLGDLLTDKGKIYSAWQAPTDPTLFPGEYLARPATREEIETLIGDSGGRELLPGKSIRGHVTFEMPENENLVEVCIDSLRPLIEYDGAQ